MSGKRTLRTSLPLLAALALAALPHAAAASTVGDSTHGHGTISTGGSAVLAFVFDAQINSGPTVTGRARFIEAGGVDLDLLVNCLTVSGNTAIVGGTVVNDPSTSYAFKVTDNGGGSPADRITLPQEGQTCGTFNTLTSFALTSGDVDVDDQP